MASKGPNEGNPNGSKSSTFELQFQEFSSYITHFEGCLKETQVLLKTLKEAFKGKAGITASRSFMTEKEEKELEANLAKKSTILVVGQTNSGKSSFVNELLGGTYLPTAEVPCTSRIVRLKFSETNYVQLLDKAGKKIGGAKLFTKKSIPRTEIALGDTERSSEEWVEQVVEVGINNSLLQNGHLEFVDAPGMSENDALDTIVKECLDGVLQVVIYVIDGNSSLRTQERDFLYKLKEKMGHLPIFFVCNKVDRNEEAEEFDRDDDDDEEDVEEAVRTVVQEKTKLSYTSLVRSGLLSEDVKLEECDVYHGVSTKEVRKARREGETNQYTEEFEKMKSKLLRFAVSSITSHLRSAAGLLSQVQQRVFHFFLSRGLKRDDPKNIETVLERLIFKELQYHDKIRGYIRDNEAKLTKILSAEIKARKELILLGAENLEFSPIKIGDVIGRNEVVHQCRTQIQKAVLMQVTNISLRKGRGTVMTISEQLKTSLEKSFEEVSKQGDVVGKIVKKQLLNCIYLNYRQPNVHHWEFDYSLMTAGYKYVDQAYNIFKDLTSIFTGTTINKEWKRKIAEDMIEHIDHAEIARTIFDGLSLDLEEAHKVFIVNVEIIQYLCEAERMQSADQRAVVATNSPSFAEQMCKTEALLQSLASSRVQLGKEVGIGHRGVVYECSVHGMGDVIAKQLNLTGGSSISQYLAIQYAMKRAVEDCESILKPISLRLDYKNHVTILLPRMEVNLYDALNAGRVKGMEQSTRLAIVLQMTNACDFSRHCGLYLVDPRITNIFLDERKMAKLNVCKTRDDHVPYPDNKAAFHVPQEKPADRAPAESYLAHDLYSLGVLLWLLLNGVYCRPEYAQTTQVEEVYSAVASFKKPNVSCLVNMKHGNELRGLLESAWFGWRIKKAGLESFHEGLELLYSKSDSQTGYNTDL